MKDQVGVLGRTRRSHDRAFKSDLIAQSLFPGASVSGIAMKYGVNANLLFKWRRDHLKSRAACPAADATLLPVCVIGEVAASSTVRPEVCTVPVNRGSAPSVIEVEIAGAQVRLRGAVDETALSTVLRALRQSA